MSEPEQPKVTKLEKFRVQATRKGFMFGRVIEAGEIFTVSSDQFSDCERKRYRGWMRRLPAAAQTAPQAAKRPPSRPPEIHEETETQEPEVDAPPGGEPQEPLVVPDAPEPPVVEEKPKTKTKKPRASDKPIG